MLKYILIVINFLILLIAPKFQTADSVSVTTNMPSSAKPGGSFNVDITIKKGAVGGFAKLQQELPEGLSASSVETKGATFTFVDHKVKFVWVSLPGDAEFTISYKVTVAVDATGEKSIGGTFSYLENNESRKYNITPGVVSLGGDAPVAAAQPAPAPAPDATQTAPQPTPAPEPAQANPTTPPVDATAAAPAPAPPAMGAKGGVEVIRTAPASIGASQTEFTVELTVRKENVSGFAKIQEDLPEGFTATAIDTKGATFTFTEQKAKFVWMSLPPGGEFKISYKVAVAPNMTGTKAIDGLFSYLENSDSKKYTIPTNNISIGEGASAQAAPTETTPKVEEPAKPADVSAQNATSASGNETAAAAKPKNRTGNDNLSAANQGVPAMSNVPAPVTGIEYRIQVSAAKMQIPNPNEFFKTKYAFSDAVNTEMHEGWHKYTAGSFPVYINARNYRNEAWGKGINGSFVVAYNSGTRITVQEALLITKQKWVQ